MINTWSFLLSSLPWEMPRWAIYCTIYCDNVGTDQRQSYLRHVYPRLYRKQTGNLVAFETFSKFVSIMVGVNLNSLCQGSLRKENMKKTFNKCSFWCGFLPKTGFFLFCLCTCTHNLFGSYYTISWDVFLLFYGFYMLFYPLFFKIYNDTFVLIFFCC